MRDSFQQKLMGSSVLFGRIFKLMSIAFSLAFILLGSALVMAQPQTTLEMKENAKKDQRPKSILCQEVVKLLAAQDKKRELKNKILECSGVVIASQDSEQTLPKNLQRYHSWIKKLGAMHIIELQIPNYKTYRLYLLTSNPDTIKILAKGSKISFTAQVLFDPVFSSNEATLVLHNEELVYDVMNN